MKKLFLISILFLSCSKNKSMENDFFTLFEGVIKVEFKEFDLLMSYNPCDVFTHFGVKEMHGLSLKDCKAYNNTKEDAYIAGFTNLSPKTNKPFLFINLSRCTDDIHTFALIFHETMHLASIVYEEDWKNKQEEMISYGEKQAHKIYKIVKKHI